MQTKIIVAFGDSITAARNGLTEEQRWPRILGGWLAEAFPDLPIRVLNAGVGGNSAREAMARLDQDVLKHSPDIVLLQFGGNNNDPARPERRVSPKEFKDLLEQFRQAIPDTTQVVVITFPPVFREAHVYWQTPRFRDYLLKSVCEGRAIEDYVAMTRAFAAKHGFPIYDLHTELGELGARDGWQTYTLPDGVHLTPAGNEVLARGVLATLRPIIARWGCTL